jgi:hypothetical protein
VTGDPIDRLFLAAKARRGAGVDQNATHRQLGRRFRLASLIRRQRVQPSSVAIRASVRFSEVIVGRG